VSHHLQTHLLYHVLVGIGGLCTFVREICVTHLTKPSEDFLTCFGRLLLATRCGVQQRSTHMTRFALIAAASAFCLMGAQAGEDVSFEDVDTNADGFVTETEFVTWKTASGEVSAADALMKFIAIDADGSGMISPSEMEAAMAAADDDETDTQDDMTSPEDPLD
jgi:hypothetical protein